VIGSFTLKKLFSQDRFVVELNFLQEVVVPNIFKIIDAEAYEAAKAGGVFQGAAIDIKDGYIHFSTAEQVRETARIHFASRTDLMLVAVAAAPLGPALKWEPSRGGQLFPHLYAPLAMSDVVWAKPLPWNGRVHVFPPETFT
jgi:uncharacterized protein (DUF952 family)